MISSRCQPSVVFSCVRWGQSEVWFFQLLICWRGIAVLFWLEGVGVQQITATDLANCWFMLWPVAYWKAILSWLKGGGSTSYPTAAPRLNIAARGLKFWCSEISDILILWILQYLISAPAQYRCHSMSQILIYEKSQLLLKLSSEYGVYCIDWHRYRPQTNIYFLSHNKLNINF